MRPAEIQAIILKNQQAAKIILADPERYAGLSLMWAEAIRKKHGVDVPDEAPPELPGFEECLEREEAKNDSRNLKSRRKRWDLKEWRVSRKGNAYIVKFHFTVVVYQSAKAKALNWEAKWRVWITDQLLNNSKVDPKAYRSEAEAKSAAFDFLVQMQQERELSNLPMR